MFWIQRNISVKKFMHPLWYTAYDKCHKAMGEAIDTLFECLFCAATHATAIPWYYTIVQNCLPNYIAHCQNKYIAFVTATKIRYFLQARDETSLQSLFELSNKDNQIIYFKSARTDTTYSDLTKFTVIFTSEQTIIKTTHSRPRRRIKHYRNCLSMIIFSINQKKSKLSYLNQLHLLQLWKKMNKTNIRKSKRLMLTKLLAPTSTLYNLLRSTSSLFCMHICYITILDYCTL